MCRMHRTLIAALLTGLLASSVAQAQLDAQSATALINQGRTQLELGKARLALKSYDEAISLNPRDPAAFVGRAGVLVVQQRYERAVRDYEEAVRLGGGGDVTAALGRAVAQQSKRVHDEALRCYDAAIARNPQDAAALGARCHVKALADSPSQAREDCDRSLSIRPDHADTFAARARVNLALGNAKQARSDWDAAISLTSSTARWSGSGIAPTSTCPVQYSAAFGAKSDGISLLATLFFGRALAREKQGDAAGSEADLREARRLVRSEAEWRVITAVMERWLPD